MRQDPDVILVGEVRDLETAEIAFRAANTGHLVLTTLHTNSSFSAVERLLDLGVRPLRRHGEEVLRVIRIDQTDETGPHQPGSALQRSL